MAVNPQKLKKVRGKIDELNQVLKEVGISDPFNYGRMKEIAMASCLGHTFPGDHAGADAYDDGEPVEYKSTIQNSITATYNGISVKETWEKQKEYLRNEKICKYSDHYYARFSRDSLEIVELWKLSGEDVYELLLPKLKRQYFSDKNRKDPRLGSSIGKTDIETYGEKIK